jgi:7-carboxy-7-deazaguanine synthase
MEQKTLPVSEIFYSIDGEGARTGAPTIFIRLFGCNLKCTYCDTRYACEAETPDKDGIVGYDMMDFDRILYNIRRYEPCKCITLTGGEPLIHPAASELVTVLRENGYWVNIETNGSIDLEPFIAEQDKFGPKKSSMDYFFTMDWKSITSGESTAMLKSNLDLLEATDVLKFVVGSDDDLNQMKKLLEDYPDIDAQIYVSPVWGEIAPDHIVEYLLNNKLVYVKVQVQLHKIIWRPDKRGV